MQREGSGPRTSIIQMTTSHAGFTGVLRGKESAFLIRWVLVASCCRGGGADCVHKGGCQQVPGNPRQYMDSRENPASAALWELGKDVLAAAAMS